MATKRVIKVVGLSGALNLPSPTTAVVDQILKEFSFSAEVTTNRIVVAELLPDLARSLDPHQLPLSIQQVVAELALADVLVVATPVSKASYPGLFKHLIDLLDAKTLQGKLVILAATGSSDQHALMLEHQLRPLFSFFSAITLPSTLFVKENALLKLSTGHGYQFQFSEPLQRIKKIVQESQQWLLLTNQFTVTSIHAA